MKSTISETREKHPATRGDVYEKKGRSQNCKSRPRLTHIVSLRLTPEEAAELEARAANASMSVSGLIRDRVLGGEAVSRETSLILAAVGRLRLLLTRLRAVDEGGVEATLGQAEQWADGVDERVAAAIASGGKLTHG
jgi:hypothetical protein